MLKWIKIGDRSKLAAHNVYIYQTVIKSLLSFCARPGFLDRCNSWRHAVNRGEELTDIYDARVWKELYTIEGVPFLSLPNNICLALYVDWFNSYKQTPSL